MGKRCCLKDCKNYDGCGTGISFHRMRPEWMGCIPSESLRLNTKTLYICSEHFTLDNFQPSFLGYSRRVLQKTAVPTIFNCATKCISHTLFIENDNSNCFESENDPLEIDETGLSQIEIGSQTDGFDMRDVQIQTSPKRLKPSDRELELKRENRILKLRLRRRDRRIESMKKILEFHRNHCNIDEEIIKDDCFEDLSSDEDRCKEEEFSIIVVE